ncbi:MAG: hypothetical protein JXA06_12230 [Bacteroidetes bacterium]|nr:hypothetical protein [Bacteroidota bacterium]
MIIVLRIGDCSTQSPDVVRIETPPDTNFAKVAKRTYRPKSLPLIENPKKPPVELPNGTSELEVRRIIFITGKDCLDSIKLIELKNGNFFVDNRYGKIASVEETTYLPPVIQLTLSPLVGLTISPSRDQLVSPMLGMSFATWYGRIQFPAVTIDLYGFSAAAYYKSDCYSIGLGGRWNFLTNPQIIASVAINF